MSSITVPSINFSVLRYVNKLKASGLSESTSQVIAEEQENIVNQITNERLMTKEDADVIRKDIFELRVVAKNDLMELEKRLYTFMAKSLTWSVGILVSLQALFHIWG